MIAAAGRRLSAVAEKIVPDPFVLALVLSMVSFVVAVVFGSEVAGLTLDARVATVFDGWFKELWNGGLMKFAMQMCIVLVTGHALAMTSAVRATISWIARRLRSPRVAVAVVALVACLASLVQWGLGAVAGAFMARETGRAFQRDGRAVHYPLLGAAGYAGFLVWHGGLSGSAPLKVAEKGHFLESVIGVIPVSETLLSPLNLAVTGAMLVIVPATFYFLMPTEGEMVGCEVSAREREDDAPARPLLNIAFGVVALAYLARLFMGQGFAAWNLDSINLLFFALGLLLHKSPEAYMRAVVDGVHGCAGILIQFPLYFGILGILKSSGLIVDISQAFIAVASATTYPVLTFVSAGVVNFFVPSGGGQWAVQGPVMLEGVAALGVAPSKVVMALAYGDAWTNMLQPFWALPLLGIMGIEAKDILGYTALVMAITGPVIVGILLVL